MQIYGIKTCDTCRKAVKSLPQAQFVDLRTDGISEKMLLRALEIFGDRLVNTRSTTWRGLSETERTKPPLELLTTHPTLMKRPLIVDQQQMYLGWTADVKTAMGVE